MNIGAVHSAAVDGSGKQLGPDPTVLVCLPTYNEAENLPAMVARLLGVFLSNEIHGFILIIDDNSPGGTGKVADSLRAADDRVHALHRPTRQGLGPAYWAGFEEVLSRGADLVVEMDCGFSHDPASLPLLIDAAASADLVIGSRYISGGAVEN